MAAKQCACSWNAGLRVAGCCPNSDLSGGTRQLFSAAALPGLSGCCGAAGRIQGQSSQQCGKKP